VEALPEQPDGVAWPTDDWPSGPLADGVDDERVTEMLDHVFSLDSRENQGETKAVLAVHRGRLVVERYGDGIDADTTLPSWSMCKSILHAAVGLAVGDGLLDLDAPVVRPEWPDPADPRNDITPDVLLRMSSGLQWAEDYEDETHSDVIPMLFGAGKEDMAAFAAAKPAATDPDEEFNYSSGDSVILSRVLGDAVRSTATDTEAFLSTRLFDPIGMTSATPKFDGAGTWIGSSYCFATARDFTRFGLLYLRDGMWEGERLLPDGWVDYARQLTHTCTTFDYGAHWWLIPSNKYGIFYASGYEGQYLMVAPALDLLVLRLGVTTADKRPNVLWFLNRLIRLFARARA
jgi:CubicO group peptidase (beta-lactamase class C family)